MSERDLLATLLQRQDAHTALTLVNRRSQRLCWSYAALHDQRLYCQFMLQASEVEAGDCVVVITYDQPQLLALLLAALVLDICLLPLHPEVPRQQVLDIIDRHKPRVIIVDESMSLPTWLAHSAPSLFRLCARDQHWLREVLDTPLQSRACGAVTRDNMAAEERALLLFHDTGSDGQLQALRFTRRTLDTWLRWQRRLYEAFPDQPVDADDRSSDRINVLPLSCVGGLGFCLQALLEGRTVHLLRVMGAQDCLHLLQQTDCQMLTLTPVIATELLSSPSSCANLAALRHCLVMQDSLSHKQLQQLSQHLGLRMHLINTVSACLAGLGDRQTLLADTPALSCGTLLFGEARLVPVNSNEPAGHGELWVRNETTTPCHADKTQMQARHDQDWFRTGMLFSRDDQGYYCFHSEVAAMCSIDGRLVFSHEVEAVLLRHEAVTECVAVPLWLAEGRRQFGAIVVVKPRCTLTAAQLLAFCRQHADEWLRPVLVEFCQSLPRKISGNYDRHACAERLRTIAGQTLDAEIHMQASRAQITRSPLP